jgi:hypothetical protein
MAIDDRTSITNASKQLRLAAGLTKVQALVKLEEQVSRTSEDSSHDAEKLSEILNFRSASCGERRTRANFGCSVSSDCILNASESSFSSPLTAVEQFVDLAKQVLLQQRRE